MLISFVVSGKLDTGGNQFEKPLVFGAIICLFEVIARTSVAIIN